MGVNLRVVRHTLALSVLITLADLMLLVALVIQPFSDGTAWTLACRTGERFWAYMQYHWENTLNARAAIQVSGDPIPTGEGAFVISNHLGYSDYYLVQHLAIRAGMLGRCRYFVKREILRLPLFGWAFWAFGMVLVSRDWTSDSRLLEQSFGRIKKNKYDAWIILYPEGTRRTPGKVLQGQAFARERGKPELKHLLYPRTKGFIATVNALRNSHIKYIYDLSLLYSSPGTSDTYRVPSLAEQLSYSDLARKGYKYRIHVERTPIADLPHGEAGLKAWCEDAWVRKDRRLEAMMQKGDVVLN
ncbi:hypothetical protein IAU60_006109 [Kwoniella sp. DSM 27419]